MKYRHDLRHYPFFGFRAGGSVASCRSKEMHFLLGYVAFYQAFRLYFFPLCLFLSSVTQFIFIQKSKRLYGYLEEAFSKGFSFKRFQSKWFFFKPECGRGDNGYLLHKENFHGNNE